jgi:glutathione synthase/RimK-type ligase-like ATP-grasp enzyme
MLKVIFKRRSVKEWALDDVRLMSIAKLPKEEERFFIERLTRFITQRKRKKRTKAPVRFDLAILVNPEEKLAPSDEGALKKFERIGKSMGLYVERIERKDYQRISEFDALFIRETTGLNHYTYRFAKKAEAEGLVVIDDPQSILRCTNKVFLAELLNINHLPTPKTVIAGPQDLSSAETMIGYPMVLKIPDGSFSRGVEKANNREELESIARSLFEQSELILAQEFLYTEYDWRIGILNGRPLFACQYFMSKKNWKIVEHKADGKFVEGGFTTMPVDQAPPDVVATALAAANLIGDGLYGVDMKQTAKGPVIIEVNDNPNLDSGVEDKYLKDQLYREVLGEFMRRLKIRALSQR